MSIKDMQEEIDVIENQIMIRLQVGITNLQKKVAAWEKRKAEIAKRIQSCRGAVKRVKRSRV